MLTKAAIWRRTRRTACKPRWRRARKPIARPRPARTALPARDTMGSNPVVTVCVIIVAVALVLQSCVFLAFAIGAGAAMKKIFALLDELKGHVSPVLISSHQILHDAAPKVKKITANLEQISDTVTHQTVHLNAVVDDVLRRSQAHIHHADAIVGQTLETVDMTR